jgi:hypothetical protein
MKKLKKTTEMCRRLTKNDYVRLLLTKTFQKNVCKKNRKEILMDIVSKAGHS